MKENMLYEEKIVKVIRDLDRLGIDKPKRRELISVSFSFCGRYSGMDIGLKEGIKEAYSENLRGEYAIQKIEETIIKEENKRLVEISSSLDYSERCLF
ncbi:hypothetical protein M0R72_03585 [Candidatus Pacearchaeota archaeon]|jgi:hypothetical protein|nr:hypothetical protein [Candidatus Pacearchaeota archaeon]